MPYTTDIPAHLPDDLQQILRDLHTSTTRMFDEVQRTNRLLDRLALYPPHALPTQPWLPPGTSLPRYPAPYGPGPAIYSEPVHSLDFSVRPFRKITPPCGICRLVLLPSLVLTHRL